MAALVTLAVPIVVAEGCGMGETKGSATVAASAPAIALARGFLSHTAEPLALLRRAGASVDTTFAGSGSYPFTAPHVAARGSTLAVAAGPGEVAPETLLLVLPPDVRLTLDDVAGALGKPARLPGLPGKAWQYAIAASGGRYGVVLDGDPARHARVVSITAIRER